MKKLIILICLLIFIICTQVFAQSYIHVKPSPDVDRLLEMTREISFLLSDCLMGGMNHDDDYVFSGKQKKLKDKQRECACANKEEVKKILKGLNIILARHPKWKGKVLFVAGEDVGPKNTPIQVSVRNLQDNKRLIGNCPK